VRHNFFRGLGALAAASALLSLSLPAHALVLTPQDGQVDNGIDVYMSAPTVQGSFVSGGVTEDFDLGCGSTWAMGAMVGPCDGIPADAYGGASTEAGTPTTGGAGSPYGRVASGDTITITLTTPASYLGFWWTGGDPGNVFRFYSQGDMIAEYTTAAVVDILTQSSLTTEDGDVYQSDAYMSNPVSADQTDEPYVYLHILAKGDFTFDTFTFTHEREVGYFEFDNVVTNTVEVTPTNDLVYVSSYGDRVADETSGGGGGGEGSSPNSLASTGFEPLGLAAPSLALIVGGAALIAVRRRRAS
jgi:hypothetical protein